MHVIHVFTILACLKQEDFDVRIFRQTSSDNRAGGAASVTSSQRHPFCSCAHGPAPADGRSILPANDKVKLFEHPCLCISASTSRAQRFR